MCSENNLSLPVIKSTATSEPIIALNEDEVSIVIGLLYFFKEEAHEELSVEDEELLQRLENAMKDHKK